MSINDLDSKLNKTWTSVARITGTDTIPYSAITNADDVLFLITTSDYHVFSILIPGSIIRGASVNQYFETGYYKDSSENARIQIATDATNKVIRLGTVYVNGANIISSTRLSVSIR